jgi:hypothetical protein
MTWPPEERIVPRPDPCIWCSCRWFRRCDWCASGRIALGHKARFHRITWRYRVHFREVERQAVTHRFDD